MTVTSINTTLADLTSKEISKPCPAKQLTNKQRQHLAEQTLSGCDSVSELARKHETSRKFVYQQKAKAKKGIEQAFSKEDSEVLFYLPVTKAWITQVVLALVLYCHAPFRGVIAFCRDILGYSISIGSIHNKVQAAIKTSQERQNKEDLSRIKAAANDEIFQGGKPVLAGVDLDSTYCYFLSAEAHRDATTWGVHLLDCQAKGFDPEYIIADGGTGLRAGQKEAMPETPCEGDVFHVLMDMKKVCRKLDNKAYRCITEYDKQNKAGLKKDCLPSNRAEKSYEQQQKSIKLADDVHLLWQWLRHDVLGMVGSDATERNELYDFIVDELQQRESESSAIRPIRRSLKNQKKDVLKFSTRLDNDLKRISLEMKRPIHLVRQVVTLQHQSPKSPHYWKTYALLQGHLGDDFLRVMQCVSQWKKGFHRTSSLVENLNSRLRQYFFLRRQIGGGYLDLLRFYLNHHRFDRSRRPERVGYSPAELLADETHPHWLEMLGFTLFQRPTSH
jgi:hypothetical protein